MQLPYDPGDGERFKEQIRALPGYPAGEELPIRAMLFERAALLRLPEVLALAGAAPARPLLVVMDETPMRRAGDELKPLVLALLGGAGWRPEPLVLAPDATGQVHTDFAQIDRVRARLGAGDGAAVLAVGSGTVADIAKHACFLHQRDGGPPTPLVLYQTANSVSAFTSNMAPVFVDGVKRTLASRYPDALVCDLETLCDAPRAMTAAGVGDLLAACGSFADWYLAHRLGLDPSHSPLPQSLVGSLDETLLASAPAIREATPEGMALLAKLIALAGLAMSLAHATAPLSGYEHVISHVLDLLAERAGRPLAPHGQQVALATILSAAAWRRFLASFDPAAVALDTCYPPPERMEAQIRTAFAPVDPSGAVAAECWADYRLKLAAWGEARSALAGFLAAWPAERARLAELARPPGRVAEVLRAVGAPLAFEALEPPQGEEQVRFAFLNAPLIRRRLTLGDLPIFFGWDREALWREAWGIVETGA